MGHEDFHSWNDYHSIQRTSNIKINDPKPLLTNIVQIIATRGSKKLSYKTSFDGDLYQLDFLSIKGQQNVSKKPDSLKKPCGVNEEVKKNMVKNFLPLMPSNRHSFWQNLLVEEPIKKTVQNNKKK